MAVEQETSRSQLLRMQITLQVWLLAQIDPCKIDQRCLKMSVGDPRLLHVIYMFCTCVIKTTYI